MKEQKILFILKKSYEYSEPYAYKRSGLLNSATFLKNYIQEKLHINSKTVTVIDANSIDREVHGFQPTMVIIEAIWCPPYKLIELSKLYPFIKWIVRVHSKVPFLSHEGIAITWIKEYNEINNVYLSFNNLETNENFKNINIKTFYLPNIYYSNYEIKNYISPFVEQRFKQINKNNKNNFEYIHVGCFGAIRPMKNQLMQAMTAIEYANNKNKKLYFHINATRVESNGEGTLKNIRALFKNSSHELIEWEWLEHKDFIYLIKQMNFGMQVSLSESFNIVTADFVENNVPIIVSKDIEWMPCIFKSNPLKIENILHKLSLLLHLKTYSTTLCKYYLKRYNKRAKKVWKGFLCS